jgi:hypothetical protein
VLVFMAVSPVVVTLSMVIFIVIVFGVCQHGRNQDRDSYSANLTKGVANSGI